jgi:hypothetical protein
VPPVETTIVRGPQHSQRILVQSVHFSHLDHDGTVTTNSVLDLATRPYPSPVPFPDSDITESSNDGSFDSLDVFENTSPSQTFHRCTDENTASTDGVQNETSAEVVPGFFDIDPEDEVTNTQTGERKTPKRPHQVCSLNLP